MPSLKAAVLCPLVMLCVWVPIPRADAQDYGCEGRAVGCEGGGPAAFPSAATVDTVVNASGSAGSATPAGPGGICVDRAGRNAARAIAAGTFVTGNVVLWRYFKRAWWSGEEAKGFFFNSDWDENFRDQDKFGHFFGGYHLTRIGDAMLQNACFSDRKAITYAAIYATLFQLQIEIWDARYEKYGFSYPDLITNTAGMLYAVAQHKYPTLRKIKPTISYSRSAAMQARNAGLLPDSEIRQSLDYSGQTYWMSAEVDPFLPPGARRYWPDLLRFSIGHSITDWIDPTTGASIRAKRKILLSLDLDASKLPGNHPIWRTVKNTISYIRLPAPAIQISPKFDAIGWYR